MLVDTVELEAVLLGQIFGVRYLDYRVVAISAGMAGYDLVFVIFGLEKRSYTRDDSDTHLGLDVQY